jgi:hypothetical protein
MVQLIEFPQRRQRQHDGVTAHPKATHPGQNRWSDAQPGICARRGDIGERFKSPSDTNDHYLTWGFSALAIMAAGKTAGR